MRLALWVLLVIIGAFGDYRRSLQPNIRGREWSRLHPLPFKTGRETFTSSGS
ncbi:MULTISPECIES: hypothetical protein [Limnospira]|uniref:hypothetical protein n=1 Tax=Limnospira TaxID=2596745 RepID=UPI0012FF1F85|nr:hypothetical protein [Limnospira indica]QNH57646.1 MAG: hypothetical protein H2674_26865 [Limnospira indica BM01]